MKRGYAAPDVFAHVLAFAPTCDLAQQIASFANRDGHTRAGKFVPGTFHVVNDLTYNGQPCYPAVVGTLAPELLKTGTTRRKRA